ncbi:4-hydroxy-tetrahydrodipicolinate reductase [Marinicella sediminis]|uniref:4-hydroxy-tetrahydrodipicolinate reductase n=1 Tax=Marinicella sediminis TaxID=1792834 RepID=A0ABV7J6T0_9GAMM|nr:4-hydroxy-tetrahydrodipicolinate reductase [Marinicella sediminis]
MPQPINVIISGVSGRIGRRLLKLVIDQPSFKLVAGLVSPNSKHLGKDLSLLLNQDGSNPTGLLAIDSLAGVKADVVIDFSQPDGFDELVDYCVLSQIAFVSGTTGLNQDSFDRLSQAAKYIPVMWTSNFSLNIQIMKNLLQILRQTNEDGVFSITETHHIHKKDMPSGTAISLAQALSPESNMTKVAADAFQLGDVAIKAIREGEVPGIHEVTCQLPAETMTFKHESHDPAIFAQGALNAAAWIHGKTSGYYDLNSVLMG